MDASSWLVGKDAGKSKQKVCRISIKSRSNFDSKQSGSGSCEAASSSDSNNSISDGSGSSNSNSDNGNNRLERQNRSNNNNKSYSKIFQYLPDSLNLNYTLNYSKSNCNIKSSKPEELAHVDNNNNSKKSREQLLVGRGKLQSPVSNSIVSALSRFKISSTASKQRQQVEASLSLLDNFQQQKVGDSRQLIKTSNVTSSFDNDNDNLITLDIKSSPVDSKTNTSNYPVVKTTLHANAKAKRKGFLYLKKNGFTSTSNLSAHEFASSFSLLTASLSPAQSFEEKRERKVSGKRRDSNNNSITSLLSSSCQQDEEHKTCLLEEVEEDQDYEEDKQQELQQKQKRTYNNRHRLEPTNPSMKMSYKISCNRSSCNNRSCYAKKGSQAVKTDSKALILAGCLMTLGLVAIFSSKLVLAQQHPRPFRSQSGALSQPPQQVGQLGPQSQSLGSSTGANQVGSASPASGIRPPSQPGAGSLMANINCNKIRGHVTLTPNLQGGTTVSTQISAGPPGEVYQWSVHQFPVKPGAAMCSCSALILGTKLIDLSEMHVGHSLMLRGIKTGMVACATFLPTSRKSNYRAKLHTPLSGSVTIFQTAFGTSFISHLMYSNGTRRHSMHRFDLVKSEDDIVTTSLLSGTQAGAAPTGGRAESFALEQREHENELSQCRRFINGEPLFKNITYQLAVSTENFGMRGRTSMVLPQIPFETFSSIYVIIYSEYDPGEPIACAPLKFVKPKTAAAKFQSVNVQGSVVFSQDSPYDVTVARINLNLPNSDGHSYGIDELPMIIRRKSDTRVCPNIREIIYNPHHVEPSSVPPEGEATSDQYAVGDLSGKYGSLTGKSSEKTQVNDFNLPLFGPISIVGRAMTIYSAEGVAIACSNVELTTPMTTAFATFDFGIQGQFIFRQPVNDCNGDTYVYIEVSKPVASSSSSSGGLPSHQHAGDMFRSLDHNWHIHVNPVDSGLDHLSTTDCLPAGPHYNPYNTSTLGIYSRDCTPFNVLRCELGDLSAKMFTIEIPPYRVKGGQEPDIGKFFGTDIDLPLCGPVSIVNRSVVVHVPDFGLQRLACSTVIEFKPRTS